VRNNEQSEPDLLLSTFSGLQHAISARVDAVSIPGWQHYCRGLIAAAATFTDPRDGCVYTPSVAPIQLQLLVLVLEYAAHAASSTDPQAAAGVTAALNLQSFFLLSCTVPSSHSPADAAAVVRQLWLQLGLVLLQRSGMAEEEEEDEGGEQAAAGTGGANSSSRGSSSSRSRQGVGGGGGAGSAARGGAAAQSLAFTSLHGSVLNVPTAATAQLDILWGRYAAALWRTLSWCDSQCLRRRDVWGWLFRNGDGKLSKPTALGHVFLL
jgi:hypothetical protein